MRIVAKHDWSWDGYLELETRFGTNSAARTDLDPCDFDFRSWQAPTQAFTREITGSRSRSVDAFPGMQRRAVSGPRCPCPSTRKQRIVCVRMACGFEHEHTFGACPHGSEVADDVFEKKAILPSWGPAAIDPPRCDHAYAVEEAVAIAVVGEQVHVSVMAGLRWAGSHFVTGEEHRDMPVGVRCSAHEGAAKSSDHLGPVSNERTLVNANPKDQGVTVVADDRCHDSESAVPPISDDERS